MVRGEQLVSLSAFFLHLIVNWLARPNKGIRDIQIIPFLALESPKMYIF